MLQLPEQLLNDFKRELAWIYQDRLRGVYLFGSYARGDQDAESDLDVLIVLDDYATLGPEIRRTGEVTSRLSLEYGVSISRTFLREIDWLRGDSSLLRNVREEAIPA